MGKRKYPEIKGYWVYSIQVPSINKYYIGVSRCKECYQRWQKSLYNGTALEPYLDEFDSMIKTVLVDNLTKEEALKYEDALIQELQMNDLCINSKRSGLIANDINSYNRELLKNNTEYHENHKQLCKQWREDNKEKIREYNKQYYEKNKEKQRQRRVKKKLEKQVNQLTLFDLAS